MKSRIVVVLLILVFLALVANLVVVAITGTTPVTEDTVKALAFWVLVAANLALAGAGMYFNNRAHNKREKSSLKWATRACLATLVITLILALAPWYFYQVPGEITRVNAMFEIALVLLLFGISNGLNTFAFYREYLRAVGTRPNRTRSLKKRPRPGPRPAETEAPADPGA